MMPKSVKPSGRNLLLRALSPDDFALIDPYLEPVDLECRFVLERPCAPIEYVYFLNSGIASLVTCAGRDRRVGVGLFGREGMSATEIVMGDDCAVHECFMQIGGGGQRIARGALQEALALSTSLRPALLRFVLAAHVQATHTALANARAQLEERLCRWLLMCHDRVDGDELPVTHELLSMMLGVRRAGITVAVHTLEGRGLIRTSRGSVTIQDREGMETCADGIYGRPEAEYQRLIGVRLTE